MDKHTNKIIGVLITIIAVLVMFIALSSSSTLVVATISYILGTIIG